MAPPSVRPRLTFAMALCLAVMTTAAGRANELDNLISLAFSNSPVLHAVSEEVRQAMAARDAAGEFFDPRTTTAAGRLSGDTAATPLLGAPTGLPLADACGVSSAVEVPVRPGIYTGVGVSEQYLVNPAYGITPGYRTFIGAQIRIPLFQDRGFSLWKRNLSRLKELQAAADARLLETRQAVRHAVEQTYIDYLVEIANAATLVSATDRAQQLLKEAEELVRLKMVPEYQLAPARLELAFRREEFCAAVQAIDTVRLRIAQVLGVTSPPTLTTNSNTLTDLIAGLRLPEAPASGPSFAARGALCEIEALATAAAFETRSMEDRLRPDLGISLRGVWTSEDSTAQTADGEIIANKPYSAAAVLVWQRPWSQTGARARLREARAREAQLAELQRELQNRLTADLAAARREITGASERLKEIAVAVEQARQTLDSEAERFRLGEGRSRNVLDAQNDLTKTYQSRNAIVASLLKGHSNFMYATGYPTVNIPAADAPHLRGGHDGHQ